MVEHRHRDHVTSSSLQTKAATSVPPARARIAFVPGSIITGVAFDVLAIDERSGALVVVNPRVTPTRTPHVRGTPTICARSHVHGARRHGHPAFFASAPESAGAAAVLTA